jgi:hypothetical protein
MRIRSFGITFTFTVMTNHEKISNLQKKLFFFKLFIKHNLF